MHVCIVDAANMTPFYNASLCRALVAEGCQVTMLTSPFTYDTWPWYAGVDVDLRFFHLFQNRALSQLNDKPKIRRMLRALEYPFDWLSFLASFDRPGVVLHFQWAPVPALDRWVWRRLKQVGHALVYTAHNVIPHSAHQPPWGVEQLYATPRRIIVHTHSLAEELRTAFPGTASRIRVVPCGTLFNDVPELSREAARNALGLPSMARVALFWGLIEPYKGVECLIRAFSKVTRRIENAHLLIAGKPNTPVEPYQILVEQLNLSHKVHTRFEFVPTELAPAYFGAADVVVLPYLEASQSGVLLTAYRFGRAVIVTDTGGLPDTIELNKNGLVVPPGDENALADAMVEILAELEKAEAMGQYSRQLGWERYNWRDIARATIAVYREIWEA
jgi:glycosyltransferase involved in cell wall biosynthesis